MTPNQLAAIESGGVLRLIDAEVGAVHLDVVHRYSDPAEAAATLRLRDGDPTALEFYEARDRVHSGSFEGVADAAYEAWRADHAEGQAAVLLAGSADQVWTCPPASAPTGSPTPSSTPAGRSACTTAPARGWGTSS